MAPNPKLLILIVSCGLTGTLLLYLLSWGFALRQYGGALLASWALGSAALIFSAYAPFIFGITLADRPKGFFSDMTSLFLVMTTMSAFTFLIIIAAVALAVSGALYGISKVIT